MNLQDTVSFPTTIEKTHYFHELGQGFSFDANSGEIGLQQRQASTTFEASDFNTTEKVRLEPLRSIALSVSQSCNMACSYCYAQGGHFGAKPQLMDKTVALAAIQKLIEDSNPGDHVSISFLGGEPLLNKKLLYQAVAYANAKGRQHDVEVGFAITTNATLLEQAEIDLFEQNRFSISISIDGSQTQHDLLRPLRNGQGSYAQIATRIEPLLKLQDRLSISARATVTPLNMDLPGALKALTEMGFREIGFSPLMSSPTSVNEMQTQDFDRLLGQMIECGDMAIQQISRGQRPEFANFTTALNEIHQGKRKQHPCGAGNGYAAVGADAKLYSCHRTVNDDEAVCGSVLDGVDQDWQTQFVELNQVDKQPSCATCWAKRLCGGGCYHEVRHRGRPACGYIRGWLDYCLKAYVKTRLLYPEYYAPA